MAIAGKKKIQIYVDEENYEYVKGFLETTRFKGGMSAFVDTYLGSTAKTLRAANYSKGKKLSLAKLLKIGVEGLKQEIA